MWFRGSGSRKDGGRDAKTPRFLGLMPRLDILVLAVWKHGNVKRMGCRVRDSHSISQIQSYKHVEERSQNTITSMRTFLAEFELISSASSSR